MEGTMKVKMFTGQGDVTELEKEANQWLSEHNVSPLNVQIKQSYAYDSRNDLFRILISLWYEADFVP
jgi:hypothetical protein